MLGHAQRLTARLLVPVVVAALIPVLGTMSVAGATPPDVPPFGASIDAYAAWDDERTCSRWEKPGVAAFRTLVLQTYPSTLDWQNFQPCNPSNDTGHQQGTALDWGIPVSRQADANEFLDWLLATRDGHADALARRFGIMYIIWQGRIWRSYPHDGAPAGTWGTYGGSDQHDDHVHFSFSAAGANKRTTWWTGQQHVVVSNREGGLFHAIRAPGDWTGWGDVEGRNGPLPTNQIHAGAADVAGQLHVLATSGGELYHSIRRSTGGWTEQWGNVENQHENDEVGTVSDVAVAEVHGVGDLDEVHDLHVVAATSEGGLWHTIRGAGGWSDRLGDVEGVCGRLPAPARQVSAAGYRDQLNVLAVVDTTPQRQLLHCQRTASGWSGWGNVENVGGDAGNVSDVAAAMVGANLHVAVTNDDGGVRHTVRDADGDWTRFADVEGQSGSAGVATDIGATGRENGELHVMVTNSQNQLRHTVRFSNGSWRDAWGVVEGQTGGLPGAPLDVNMS